MRGFGAVVGRAICPSTVTGHSSAVGCVRIGAFPKRNSRSTWGSSSSCTTSASEAKRCFLRSLSCWSRKTLESNKSDYRVPGIHHASGQRLLYFILVLHAGGTMIAHFHYDPGCPTPGHHLISTSIGGLTMTTFRPWSVFVLLACLGAVALHASPATAA